MKSGVKEHDRCLAQKKDCSAVAKHSIKTGHNIDFEKNKQKNEDFVQ